MARGFLSELNRIAKQSARDAERARKKADRERRSAAVRADRARKADERAAQQLVRGRVQEQKKLEKEAKEAHVAAQMALVDHMNAELHEIHEEIDTLLQATLVVDDFVDLESLKGPAVHPPFDRTDLEKPLSAPSMVPAPRKPSLSLPAPPRGLRAFFGKKKHERAMAATKSAHERALQAWEANKAQHMADCQRDVEHHKREEDERLVTLAKEKERYSKDCRVREAEVEARNAEVDKLIADLGYGVQEAIEEYVSIVLENSVYPEHFSVKHDFSFDSATAELKLSVFVPAPDALSNIKAYKYVKAKDEITSTELSQKALKDRYLSAAEQVALRTLHEVFEADRRGLIQTISLVLGTETTDPVTGHLAFIPFIATGAEREPFLRFDLSSVVPLATLKHLGASISKNPLALEAADTSGIRKA